MPEPTRVLLVDDHAMMRAGFRLILSAEPDIDVVGEAGTGTEAVEAAHRLQPDVICMDVQMPDMDGVEATRLIVADDTVHAAVLIVTTFDRDDYLFSALSAGAAGFVLKNAGPEELVRAVRVAAAGDALLAPEVTRRVIARFAGGGVTAEASGIGTSTAPPAPAPTAPAPAPRSAAMRTDDGIEPPEMTAREREVLALMADARSNAEIAAQLFIGEATVKTHVSNVLTKLAARDRVQAVVRAYRLGLV